VAPNNPTPKSKNPPLKTSTIIIILGAIAAIVFFVLPGKTPKEVAPVAVEIVQEKKIPQPPAPPTNNGEFPVVDFTEDGVSEVCDIQRDAVHQQLEIIKQQVAILESSIETLNRMMILHELQIDAGN